MESDNNYIHKQANQLVFAVRSKSELVLTATVLLLLALAPVFVMAQQIHFATPETAGDKLYEVVETHDASAVAGLFGAEYLYLLPLDEVNAQDRELFINAWKQSHKLIPGERNVLFIEVGLKGWTFPIPLLKSPYGWYFDSAAGAEIIQTRRIGRNELSTMQAALAYHDAQLEYAEEDRNGNGVLEYAQKFISTPNKKDGLYWEVEPGETPSPLGELFTGDTPEGAYFGYYYKILKEQGESARGGGYSYLSGDRMKFGFALLAWPAEYGETGVMSFMINHDGVLLEKNLGPDTEQIAADMNRFEPGKGWSLVRPEEIFW